MEKSYAEQLLDELSVDSNKLYHENIDSLEKARLLEDMISNSENLVDVLKSELNALTS